MIKPWPVWRRAVILLLALPSLALALPVRTGTPIRVELTQANTGSTSVTVPSDAQIMVCGLSGFDTNSGYYTGGSLTIGGGALTAVTGGDTAPLWMAQLFYRVTPATGSQTLAWDWLGTNISTEEGALMCAWYKDIDTGSAVRATSCTHDAANPHETGTMTAQTGDLAVAFVLQFSNSDTTFTWVNATEVTEFTKPAAFADGALAEATPSGNIQISASGLEDGDGGVCGIVLKPAAGGIVPPRRIIIY